jgi:hypothetical protein
MSSQPLHRRPAAPDALQYCCGSALTLSLRAVSPRRADKFACIQWCAANGETIAVCEAIPRTVDTEAVRHAGRIGTARGHVVRAVATCRTARGAVSWRRAHLARHVNKLGAAAGVAIRASQAVRSAGRSRRVVNVDGTGQAVATEVRIVAHLTRRNAGGRSAGANVAAGARAAPRNPRASGRRSTGCHSCSTQGRAAASGRRHGASRTGSAATPARVRAGAVFTNPARRAIGILLTTS